MGTPGPRGTVHCDRKLRRKPRQNADWNCARKVPNRNHRHRRWGSPVTEPPNLPKPGRPPPNLTVKSGAIILGVIGGTIVLAWIFLAWLVPGVDGVAMRGPGPTAMILGVLFSIVIGVGPMALVVISRLRGISRKAVVEGKRGCGR